MPKQRLQVDVGIPDVNLRPAAKVRDTYAQPTGAGSQASQLAQALSQLAPELARFGTQLGEKQDAKSKLAGEQRARETVAALDQSRTTYAQAVKDGKIANIDNPWMKQGYYEELGRAYAGRLQADLTSAIETDENLKNTVEMSDFRSFTSKFEADWMKANVPDDVQKASKGAFQVGYGNRRDSIVANLEAGWASQTEQRFTQRTLSMFRDEAVQFTHDALDKEFTPEEIGDFLRSMWDDKHALGWDGRQTGQALIDAVSDVAIARKDPALMDKILESIPGGDGKNGKSNNLLRTAYATAKIEETKSHIFDAQRDEWTKTDRKKEEDVKAVVVEAGKRFEDAQTKGTDPDDVQINDLQKRLLDLGNIQGVEHLTTMKDAYSNKEYDDDNQTVADFLLKLHSSPTALSQASLDRALTDKRLSLNTFNSLSNALEEQKTKKALSFFDNDPDYKEGEQSLLRLFNTSNPSEDTEELRWRREQAIRAYGDWYAQAYRGAVPGALAGSKAKLDEIMEKAGTLYKAKVKYDNPNVFNLSHAPVDWKTKPVETEEELPDILDSMDGYLSGHGALSPQDVSILQFHNIAPDPASVAAFVKAQRKFSPAKVKHASRP